MKNITLLIVLMACSTTGAFAGTKLKKSKKASMVVATIKQSRQCCTKSGVTESGGMITITACSGSLLTNDATSYERACRRAEIALLSAL